MKIKDHYFQHPKHRRGRPPFTCHPQSLSESNALSIVLNLCSGSLSDQRTRDKRQERRLSLEFNKNKWSFSNKLLTANRTEQAHDNYQLQSILHFI